MAQHEQSLKDRVELRPVVLPDDEEFLEQLYFSLRDDLVGVLDDEGQLRQMLRIQYVGQKQALASEFPEANHDIIIFDRQPVGRLLIDRRPESMFGADIAVSPAFRKLGIGTEILRRLFNEAAERGVPFKFNVVKTNPAVGLYQKLGCRIDGDNETHFSMTWHSPNLKKQ